MTRERFFSCFIVLLFTAISISEALRFGGTDITYAKFPKWNACINASLQFEFKTRESSGLLMYTDDNGRYDFFQLAMIDGRVRLWMNVVDEKDGVVELIVGKNLNDGNWHQVKVKRNRMNTTLLVDNYQSSMMSFGSDFQFGDIYENNYVYFGGLPRDYKNNLKGLALPSSMFANRFKGEVRNILYFNCTCVPVRAVMLDGLDVFRSPREACERRNPCDKNCACISLNDDQSGCECFLTRDCGDQFTTRYYLPMDRIDGRDLWNPSGLDSRAFGGPGLIPGAIGNAIKLNGRSQYVRVTGPGHKRECFGNLAECFTGYYLGMFLKFDGVDNSRGVYLSNGGHDADNHGIAMYYSKGILEYVFRKPDGNEWRVRYDNLLEGKWYHVAATWSNSAGLMLYINGHQVDHDRSLSKRPPAKTNNRYNDFVIGQSNDRSGTNRLGTMTVDEFVFMSMYRSAKEIRETGPFYRYYLDFDQLQDDRLSTGSTDAMIRAGMKLVPGRVGSAIGLTGGSDYVNLGNVQGLCLGDLTLCRYGIYVAMWVNFTRIDSNTRYLLSSPRGLNIYYTDNRLHATASMSDRFWETFYKGIKPGVWYFLEVTWSKDQGIRLYLNGEEVSRQEEETHKSIRSTNDKNFYLGRANNPESWQMAAIATVDDFEAYYTNRDSLLGSGIIERVRPHVYRFPFESMDRTRIPHPSMVLRPYGNPKLVQGRVGKAVELNGREQYIDFGDHSGTCFGNLDICTHGATLAMFLKIRKFHRNSYYFSTGKNGLTMYYKNDRLHIQAQTSTRTWEVTTNALELNKWQRLEVTWSENRGLRVFRDNQLVAATNRPKVRTVDTSSDGRVYLGRGNMDMTSMRYGAAEYDQMEYWFADRDYLTAFGYIQRGQPTRVLIPMDKIDGNRLDPQIRLPIRVVGNAKSIPGRVKNAVDLRGGNQYLDVFDQSEECMGNLRKCLQGITISAWMRFRRFENNMVYLSTGRYGIVLAYRNGYLYASAQGGAEVSIPHPQTGVWHYIEISWHPDSGLELYVNNILKSSNPDGKLQDRRLRHAGSFLIGRANHGDIPSGAARGGNFDIDELDIIYGRRDDLLALGVIDRPVEVDVPADLFGYETFFLDVSNGTIVYHPKYVVTLVGGATLERGKVGRAASLNGRGQYVDLGDHKNRCFANLELCRFGMTMSFWLKPRKLRENDVFLSSPAYSVYYEDGELNASFNAPGKTWMVSTPRLRTNRWQLVTLSWHPSRGLRMFLDDNEVDSSFGVEGLQGDQPKGTHIFIGKALDDENPRYTADALVDEVQFWDDDIDLLRSAGRIGGTPREYRIDLGGYNNGFIFLDGRVVRGYGKIRVVDYRGARALRFDGNQQYLDLGPNFTCAGDLDSCRQGATIRFAVRPQRLTNGMYFIDSFPVTVYYRNGRLYAEMQTADKKWEVSAPGFREGIWQNVDLSWHPTYGLTMYINGRRVASSSVPTVRRRVDNKEWRTFVGGPLVPGSDRRYIDGVLGDLTFWNSRRESVPPYVPPTRPPPTRPPPTTTPRPTRPPFTWPIRTWPPYTRAPPLPTWDPRTVYPHGTNETDGTTTIIRFLGYGYVTYNFERLEPSFLRQVDEEDVTFWFLTDQRDGLIWFQDDPGRRMHISMKDGYLRFVNDQDPYGPQEVMIRPRDGTPLTDWSWHHVNISRRGRDVKFYIDQEHAASYTFPPSSRKIQFLVPAEVYLGGHPDPKEATGGLVDRTINGGIAQVIYKSMSPEEIVIVNLISSGKPIFSHGKVTFEKGTFLPVPGLRTPRPPITFAPRTVPPRTPRPTPPPKRVGPSPITFRSANVHISLPRVTLSSGTTISYKFQTINENGLMLYTYGNPQRSGTFFAIEMYDGKLYFIYNLGGSTHRTQFSDHDISDGQQHKVEVRFYNRYIILMLDGEQKRIDLSGRERLPISFQQALYLGGYSTYTNEALNSLPWHVWSRQGYQGCFEDFQIDRERMDLHQYVVDQYLFGHVDRQCVAMPRVCALNQAPCRHGVCQDNWDGYNCDCSNTEYTGKNCDRAALVGAMNGKQYGYLPFLSLGTHTNDLSLRFKTPLSDAFLFQTHTGESNEYLRAVLHEGRVKIMTNLGGTEKTYYAGENLNDLDWHSLYIRRRGNQIEAWVDEYPSQMGKLDGENFYFDVERIYLGSTMGTDIKVRDANNYIGYLQNFRINDIDVLNEIQRIGGGTVNITISTIPQLPHLIYHPVTITNRETYVQLETLRVPPRMVLSFMFKTLESSGVILFNGGRNREFIAIELYKGFLHFSYNTSDSAPALRLHTPRALNDNRWHHVLMRRNEDGRSFTVSVDGHTSTLENESSDGRLDLQGPLFIGGLPESMFRQEYIQQALLSKTGFQGCLASIDMSGAVPDLLKYAGSNNNVIAGCTDVREVCLADSCRNFGVCIPSGMRYFCDCNMTSYVGTICTEEANGFRFMEKGVDHGLLVYTFPAQDRRNTMSDEIALGFMTYEENGVLMHVKSQYIGDFIQLRLENGYLVAEYLTDSSGKAHRIIQSRRKFNDGKYHQVRFLRNSGNATLFVDSYPGRVLKHSALHGMFDKQGTIYIGGVQNKNVVDGRFNGIISGVYINGLRVMDRAARKQNTAWIGDVAIAPHAFALSKAGGQTIQPPVWITPSPPVSVPPVIQPGPGPVLPPDIGGGGVGWEKNGGAAGTGTGGGAGTGVGGGGVGIGVLPSGVGGAGVMTGPLGKPAVASAALASAGAGGAAGGLGPRAGAVVGTVLGILALMSAMMWAFYLCKPGWCWCVKPPAAGGPVTISPPRPGSNLGVVQNLGGAGASAGAGAGAGAGVKVNGSPTHGGGSFAYISSAGSGGGGAGYDSATLRATKTFTSSGTTIGTPKPNRAQLGSTTSGASGYSMSRSVVDGSTNVHGAASVSSYHQEGLADYDLAPGISGSASNYQSNMLSAGGGSMGHGGYSTSTMSSHYNYQVQTVRTVTGQQQMLGYAGSSTFAVAPGAMGEEVRVDCCLITADGRSVVTGSSMGPPQVWDMQSGELLRIMRGDTVGSTNLHLACNDRLLVGAVNADLEINQYSTTKGVTNRMLQIWDFSNGHPLEMAEHEYCSALCVMNDGDKVVFARTDKFGSGTEVVLWDLLGNQPIKQMKYDCPIGNNDFVNYINLSQNNRYVLIGFTNTFDNYAEFVVFDMTITSYNVMEPNLCRLDANPDCTAVLPRDEAITGLRTGDLVIWSLRTGEASRKLVSGKSAHAHHREVKAVAMSEDNRYLVSASADGTLKVWDMTTERQIHTLTGHQDEVWCVAISPDSEIVVSGSRDGTIRLWRMKNGSEICSFSAGVDVFHVTMSHDKSTIVALGDKYGARKLIMLQVVRSKIRRQLSS